MLYPDSRGGPAAGVVAAAGTGKKGDDTMMAPVMTDARYRRTVRRRLWWSRLASRWPFLVWLLACGGVAALYLRFPTPDSTYVVKGMVDAEAVSVSPVETARIESVAVRPGQRVQAGDLLVTMDPSLIAHGVTADVIDMISIRTAFGDTHQDVLQAVSQRLDAIAAVEVEIGQCRQDWAREEAELKALSQEQARRDALRGQGLLDELVRVELLPAIANLERAVAEYPKRMRTLERQLNDAQEYYRNIVEWLGQGEGEPVSEAIQRRLKEPEIMAILDTAEQQARLHREAYELRAPIDGVVSVVNYRPGDVVVAGVPLLRISVEHPTRIVGFLSDSQVAGLGVGDRVSVRSANRVLDGEVAATLTDLSHEIDATAYQLDSSGRPIPLRARRAYFEIDGHHLLVGGEVVYLKPELPFSPSRLLATMRARLTL